MISLILVECGETLWDSEGRLQGNVDVPLSDAGREEVLGCAQQLRPWGVELVLYAETEACRATAGIIAGELGRKAKRVAGLEEVDLGLWQGLREEELLRRHAKAYRQWRDDAETVCPPRGEPLDEVRRRVDGALRAVISKHDAKTVALVAPPLVARVIRSQLQGVPADDCWPGPENGGRWCKYLLDTESVAGRTNGRHAAKG